MKPRCQGHHDGGAHTSFLCVLDEGHDGFCEPYVPPTVDEWRAMKARVVFAEADAIELREAAWRARKAMLPVLDDALDGATIDRMVDAVVTMAYHKDALADAAWVDVDRLQAENDALRSIIESGAAQTQHPGRDLDAEVVSGVQAGRDDLRGLEGKAST